MACAKEWGLTYEQWQDLTDEQRKRYLYFETLKSEKNQKEMENKKPRKGG